MRAGEIRERARRVLRGKWIRMAGLQLLAAAVIGALGIVVTFAAMMPLTVSAFHGLDRMIYGAEATSSDLTSIPASFFAIVAVGALLGIVVGALLSVGMSRAGIAAVQGRRPGPRALFPFELLGRAVAMNALRVLIVAVGALLLVAPGVIAAYRFAMADYLLAAHPRLGPVEALRRSARRMRGRKLRLFKLQLSFLGWALLCALPAIGMQVWARAATAGGALAPAALLAFPLTALSLACELCLGAYMLVSLTIFFQRAEGKKKRAAEGPETPAA